MEKFNVVRGIAASLPQPDVNTDVIIRVERCVRTPKEELGRYAFEALRFRADGSEDPTFVLNRDPWRSAKVLVCGENFGCGSSREMAVWAIAGIGVRCVIAPSFGEIFHGNCFQNGVLAISMENRTVERLARLAEDPATAMFEIDLERQRINGDIAFEIDALQRKALLEGLDGIGLTLAREAEIAAFQQADRGRRPWVYELAR